MKICWDNLEKIRYSRKTGKFYDYTRTYIHYDECHCCGEPFLGQKNHDKYCDNKCAHMGKYNPNYRGGVCSRDITLYDTYAHQINPYEQCRRNADDPNILEVKCTYCGKWHMPTMMNTNNRISGINGNDGCRFYCSDSCKQECPIYGQRKYYKGQNNYTSREVQPELRQLTFKRDGWACIKCGCTEHLHCHHIDPVANNPIESADIDNCITLCKWCHKEAHKQKGCGYAELKKCA